MQISVLSFLFIIKHKGESILRDFREVITHNPEPYNSIYYFIKFEVIPKYPCLTSVYQSNFDEEGNPKIQYYIRYAADLSIIQEDKLFLSIFDDIMDYCKSCGIPYNQDLNVDLILTVDGDFHAKRI